VTDDRLTSAEVAALLGIQPGTWRSYVRPSGGRKPLAPPPDGMIDGRTPYWHRSTIETYLEKKAGKG
jgi:hypothetical protein